MSQPLDLDGRRVGTLASGLRFEGPFEAEAKNVAEPLRYYMLTKA